MLNICRYACSQWEKSVQWSQQLNSKILSGQYLAQESTIKEGKTSSYTVKSGDKSSHLCMIQPIKWIGWYTHMYIS